MRSSSQITGQDEEDQAAEVGFKLGPGENYDSSDSDSDSLSGSGKKARKSRFDKHKDSSQFTQIDQTSRAYIKNVLLKYFEYQAEGRPGEGNANDGEGALHCTTNTNRGALIAQRSPRQKLQLGHNELHLGSGRREDCRLTNKNEVEQVGARMMD